MVTVHTQPDRISLYSNAPWHFQSTEAPWGGPPWNLQPPLYMRSKKKDLTGLKWTPSTLATLLNTPTSVNKRTSSQCGIQRKQKWKQFSMKIILIKLPSIESWKARSPGQTGMETVPTGREGDLKIGHLRTNDAKWRTTHKKHEYIPSQAEISSLLKKRWIQKVRVDASAQK